MFAEPVKDMSDCRMSVEHSFSILLLYWIFPGLSRRVFPSALFQQEIEIFLPVGTADAVCTLTAVEGDAAVRPCAARFGQMVSRCDQSGQMVSLPCRRCGMTAEKLGYRVSPAVQAGRTDCDMPGSDCRKQVVLVERHAGDSVAGIGPVPVTEPVAEHAGNPFDILARLAACQRISRTACVVGKDILEACVLGSAPQCGLAEAGMTGDRDFLRVKQAEGQQEVEGTACRP